MDGCGDALKYIVLYNPYNTGNTTEKCHTLQEWTFYNVPNADTINQKINNLKKSINVKKENIKNKSSTIKTQSQKKKKEIKNIKEKDINLYKKIINIIIL